MSEKKVTKSEIYSAIISIVNTYTVEITEQFGAGFVGEIISRMNKDIEQANKKGSSKKETENDKLNADIQATIIGLLEKNGTMIYGDLVKAVQGAYDDDLSPQKITANVTKIKNLVDKFEDGKGKNKKLYIRLA